MSRRHVGTVHHRQAGFTILELMLATVVFSTVLLLVTTGIIQIAKVYYKGVTEANTQNTARAIIDSISQAIQFGGSDITATASPATPGETYVFCIGNQRFTYQLGWQVENRHDSSANQTWHALVRDSVSGAGCTSESGDDAIPDLSQRDVAGRDLVGEHMRLSNLVVEPIGVNMYQVKVKIVYGENDLLNNPTGPDATCKGAEAGSQFCAVSELSTVVVTRVE